MRPPPPQRNTNSIRSGIPPSPSRCPIPPEKQSNVPVVVRCVLIGLTLLGLLVIVHQVKKWSGGAAGGSVEKKMGDTGVTNAAGTGDTGSYANKTGISSSGGSGERGVTSNAPSKVAEEGASGGIKSTPSSLATKPSGGTESSASSLPLFKSGSPREINTVIQGISKDATDISSWSLYRRINFHCRSIDQVLLTLIKCLHASNVKYEYGKLKSLYDDAGLMSQSGFCARPINAHHTIMAKASVTLAMQYDGTLSGSANWDKFSAECEASPSGLDDHNARMICITAECFARVITKRYSSDRVTTALNGLRGQWTWSVDNGAPVRASEVACTALSQILLLGLEQQENISLISEANQVATKRAEKISTASNSFERLEACLEAAAKTLQIYAQNMAQ